MSTKCLNNEEMLLTSFQGFHAFIQEVGCLSTMCTGLVHIHETCQSEASGDMLANLVKMR